MTTITLSAGAIFTIGVVAGLVIGAIGLVVIALTIGKKAK